MEEQDADFLFLLLSGKVLKIKGHQNKVVLEAPSLLGEQACLSSQSRSHSVRSLEDCKVAAIHREVLRDLV